MKDHDEMIGPLAAETVEALRADQQPPGGDGYWDALHASIMARIGDGESGWWTVLNRWSRPGLAAAAVVMLIATLAMLSMRSPTQTVAYDEVVEAQSPVAVQTVLASNPRTARDATLRYVLSY
jgi:hypothetical protein